MKRFLAVLICLLLVGATCTVQAFSDETPHAVLVAPDPSEALIYSASAGDKGSVTTRLNLSYLSESYSKLAEASDDYPSSYDLRDRGVVSAVPHQGDFGLCWAFSATDSVESNLLQQFPHIDFSKTHMGWFSYYGDEEYEAQRNSFISYDYLQDGGTAQMSTASLAAWKGVVSEQVAPYNDEPLDESLRFESEYHVQDAFYLANADNLEWDPSLSEDEAYWYKKADMNVAKSIMMNNGCITLSFCSDQTNFNSDTAAWYNPYYGAVDHAVLVVGWDDNYPKENFLEDGQPENDGAWLLRNSWGEEWGDGGFFWLSYEDPTYILEPFYSLEEADNYQSIYQYDLSGWGYSVGLSLNGEKPTGEAYASNVFSADGDELLDAVSFYTTDANAEYEISVYTNLTDANDPISGVKTTATQSGVEPYAGYHTIELDEPVRLAAGESFSVIIKLNNPSYKYPVAVQSGLIDTDEPLYMGNGGESYVSIDGESWADVAGVLYYDGDGKAMYASNVCIKAFTNPDVNVDFSVFEGPVADNTPLELFANGAQEIYYTTDGSDPIENGQLYNGELSISGGMTVKAVAKTADGFGTVNTNEYTKLAAQAVYIQVRYEGGIWQPDLSSGSTELRGVVGQDSEIELNIESAADITVNGVPLSSGDWSHSIALEKGDNQLDIVVSGEGMTTTEYSVVLFRSFIDIDYYNETVSFERGFSLRAEDGTALNSGDSLTPLISDDQEVRLIVTMPSGEELDEYLPPRNQVVKPQIDFMNESTTRQYGSWNIYWTKADMSDMKNANGYIYLQPGTTLYLQRYATETEFASKIVSIEIPERPAAPEVGEVSVDSSSIIVTAAGRVEYKLSTYDDWDWSFFGQFTDLQPDTEYTVQLRYAATEEQFASHMTEVTVKTAAKSGGAATTETVTEPTTMSGTTSASTTERATATSPALSGADDDNPDTGAGDAIGLFAVIAAAAFVICSCSKRR